MAVEPSVVLAVRDLEVAYGAEAVLKRISFEIDAGEFVSFLGPSGCGKSTTLMALAGLVEQRGGEIRLGGRDITALAPEEREMGVVFQSYALFPHMSALENVVFPLRVRGVRRAEARLRARESLDLVRIADPDVPVGQLSGGQMQRVALARALVYSPQVLLMDEPMSALDRQLRRQMQFELRRLQREIGATVVYVTHDQEEALVLSDRIMVMREGRIEQAGTPEELYRNPRSAFIAGFVGESNQVEVQVTRRMGSRVEVAPTADPTVRFIARDPLDVGDGSAWLVVRPEDLRATCPAPTPPDINAVSAVVESVTFLGDHVRVDVDAAALGTCQARHPAGGSGDRPPTPGDVVTLTWDIDAGRLVPARVREDAPENRDGRGNR